MAPPPHQRVDDFMYDVGHVAERLAEVEVPQNWAHGRVHSLHVGGAWEAVAVVIAGFSTHTKRVSR